MIYSPPYVTCSSWPFTLFRYRGGQYIVVTNIGSHVGFTYFLWEGSGDGARCEAQCGMSSGRYPDYCPFKTNSLSPS